MKIYISGPITNVRDYHSNFAEAELKLQKQHPEADIFNPARVAANLPTSTKWKEYMIFSMCMLDMCDAIYMLPGWTKSTGASFELGYAVAQEKILLNSEAFDEKEERNETE